MTIWDLCIKRPIFTCMLVSAPVVMGLAAYPRLGVDLFREYRVESLGLGTGQVINLTMALTGLVLVIWFHQRGRRPDEAASSQPDATKTPRALWPGDREGPAAGIIGWT